jgi:hypothetical protein
MSASPRNLAKMEGVLKEIEENQKKLETLLEDKADIEADSAFDSDSADSILSLSIDDMGLSFDSLKFIFRCYYK